MSSWRMKLCKEEQWNKWDQECVNSDSVVELSGSLRRRISRLVAAAAELELGRKAGVQGRPGIGP